MVHEALWREEVTTQQGWERGTKGKTSMANAQYTEIRWILKEIPNLTKRGGRSVLLTSTMLAMDKVDNTMGHQVAYLKRWSKRSCRHACPFHSLSRRTPCSVSQQSIFDIDKRHDLVCWILPTVRQSENQDDARSISILLPFVDHRMSK